jgi:phage FluMu protein Com
LAQTKSKATSLVEERCLCGNLIAKVSLDGVEILCRRCKRIHLIPWPQERREGSAARKTGIAVDR